MIPFFRNEVVDYFKLNCTAADLLYELIFIFVNPFFTEIFIFELVEYVIKFLPVS